MARQLEFRFRTWGGARKDAGRRPNRDVAGVSHLPRPALSFDHPVHVTLKLGHGIQSLRGSALFRAVRRALSAGRDRFGFRLVQFSVQADHLHLLVEATNRRSLSRGVQGLSVRIARAVNRGRGRRGTVFADRYHARALKTPRETRWALRYVLLNWRKHPRSGHALPAGFVDACSSAPWFDGWNRPRELAFGAKDLTDAPVLRPRTWLLRTRFHPRGPLA